MRGSLASLHVAPTARLMLVVCSRSVHARREIPFSHPDSCSLTSALSSRGSAITCSREPKSGTKIKERERESGSEESVPRCSTMPVVQGKEGGSGRRESEQIIDSGCSWCHERRKIRLLLLLLLHESRAAAVSVNAAVHGHLRVLLAAAAAAAVLTARVAVKGSKKGVERKWHENNQSD